MPTVTPELLTELTALHAQTVAAYRTLGAALTSARDREKTLFALHESYDLLSVPDTDKQISDLTWRFRERLLRIAEEQFTPSSSARFSIPRADIANAYPDASQFEAAAFWAHLEATYKPSAAKVAFVGVARDLVDAFNLERNPNIERKGNILVLNKWVSCEKTYSGRMELSYHSADSVANGLRTLAAFADWGNLPGVAASIRRHLNHTQFHHMEIVSRQRITIAAGELELITFQTRFEFRFGGEMAKQLPLFIGQYARKAA